MHLLLIRSCGGQGSGRADSDVMCGVIGRLSVLLLDGFKEERQANPAASGKGERFCDFSEYGIIFNYQYDALCRIFVLPIFTELFS